MVDSDLRALFRRFRDSGDVAALAMIFDRTAPDLLDLARHLSRSRLFGDSPEDLVQATFVSAIESRNSFDDSRPLEPWLAGILANHASWARRRAARAQPSTLDDAARALPIESPAAADVAADRELWREVALAVASLPAPYQDVVAQKLFVGERSRDIARRQGRSSGSVRMTLHRGLSLLRRVLPHGIVASLVLLVDSRVALGAARTNVVQHAIAASHGTLLPATAALTGGLLVSKKLGLLVAAVVLTAAGVMLFRPEPASAPEPIRAATAPEPLPPPVRPADSESVASRDTVAADAGAAHDSVGSKPLAAPPESYRRALSGVRGRLLEANGSPAAGLALTLMTIDRDRLIVDLRSAFEDDPPLSQVGDARTDSFGRFQFQGIHPIGMHGIGVDLGGPRATLKVIDVPLVSGEEVDLGDIVLGEVVAVHGKVVDPDGAPIANARVRATPLPGPIAVLGLERVQGDSLVLIASREPRLVEPLPHWVRSLLDRFPVPTTRTATDGTFELSGVAPGIVTTLVDAEGFVAAAFGPSPASAGRRIDVGELELTTGRAIEGTVVDAAKRPVVGALVAGGITGVVPTRAFLERHAVTDAKGHFELPALADTGSAVVAVRPVTGGRWQVFDGETEPLVITLPEQFDHVVEIRDPSGAPVLDSTLRIAPRPSEDTMSLLERNDAFVAPVIESLPGSPGDYRLKSLPLGAYVGFARRIGSELTRFEFTVEPDAAPTRITIGARPSLVVRVIDAANRASVEYAQVRVLERGDAIVTLTRARSDAEGIARVERPGGDVGEGIPLRVEHPGYAVWCKIVAADATETVVEIERGGDLVGRFTSDGGPAAERYLLLLFPSYGQAERATGDFSLPTHVASNAAGDFAVRRMQPGDYDYEAYTNVLADDLSKLATRASKDLRSLEPRLLCRGSFQVDSGKTTELTIDVTTPGSARNGTIEGRITSAGKPLTTATIYVEGTPDRRYHDVDATGQFVIGDVPPGEVTVQVYSLVERNGGQEMSSLVHRRVKVTPGGHTTVDFRLAEHPVTVRVRDRGAPAAGVKVDVRPFGANNENWIGANTTGADGSVEIGANEPGRYSVVADDSARGFAFREIDLKGNGADPDVVLDLIPGIVAAGKVVVPPELGTGPWTLSLSCVQGEAWVDRSQDITREKPTFRFENVPPGKLVFVVFGEGSSTLPFRIEVAVDREDLDVAPQAVPSVGRNGR